MARSVIIEEGEIVSVDPPKQSEKEQKNIDITEGVAESVEVLMEDRKDLDTKDKA